MSKSTEKHLISSIVRDSDIGAALSAHITAEMFHAYPDEWAWMERYYRKHRKSPSKKAFESQFPEFRLRKTNDTPYFADEVRRQHSRFMLMGTMKDVADLLADGKIDNAVELGFLNMTKVAASVGNMVDDDIFSGFTDVLEDAKKRLRRVEEHGQAGIPTGFPTLDDRTGGPQPGDFWVIAARLGEGKSWMLQKMATAAVMHDYNVYFQALEQTRPQVVYRIHSFLSSTVGENIFRSADLMQGRNFDIKEYQRFLKKLKSRMKGSLYVADARQGRVGLMTVAAQLEKRHPDVAFIDYITLLDKKGQEWQDVAALSGGLKVLGLQNDIPMVCAAQLNRTAVTKRDEPADAEAVAQADSIGQDADVLVTQKQPTASTIVSKAAKVRNHQGKFKWYNHFDPHNGVFEEVSYTKYVDLKDGDLDKDDD